MKKKKIIVRLKENMKTSFKFRGIASSPSKDSDGERIIQNGINLSLINQGLVVVTSEHNGVPIGKIEKAEIRDGKLYVEGTVKVNNIKTNRFYKMLQTNDSQNPVTLSIEFVNPEYSSTDESQINSMVLTGVALIGINSSPSNSDTYAELIKSITKEQLFYEIIRRANSSVEFRTRLIKLLMLSNF